ncbi:MAG: beta-ribofuranosylaminobenzene 5'-phosphate synthase [Candidatus Helarchaeota archaeon]
MKIKIITPSRLHFTLIDLCGDLERVDGGIGVALNRPNVILESEILNTSDIIVNDGLDSELIYDIAKNVMNSLEIDGGIRFNLISSIKSHIGLGSKTQLSLAVAFAINYLFTKRKSIFELAKIVKRGGTSGIGVNVFQKGGFILDAGHSFGELKQKQSFLPSRASNAPPPPALIRYTIPESWYYVIAIPNECYEIAGTNEVNIFKKYCPIPKEDVGAVCRLILMVILPAVYQKNIQGFGRGLTELQKIGFKKIEVDFQPSIIKKIIKFMLEKGAYGSGISSFGPATYGLVDGLEKARDMERKVREFLDQKGGGRTFISNVNNEGMKYEIST